MLKGENPRILLHQAILNTLTTIQLSNATRIGCGNVHKQSSEAAFVSPFIRIKELTALVPMHRTEDGQEMVLIFSLETLLGIPARKRCTQVMRKLAP